MSFSEQTLEGSHVTLIEAKPRQDILKNLMQATEWKALFTQTLKGEKHTNLKII